MNMRQTNARLSADPVGCRDPVVAHCRSRSGLHGHRLSPGPAGVRAVLGTNRRITAGTRPGRAVSPTDVGVVETCRGCPHVVGSHLPAAAPAAAGLGHKGAFWAAAMPGGGPRARSTATAS